MGDPEKLIQNALLFIYARQNKPTSEKLLNIQNVLNDGADINSSDGNDRNNTVLHIAVQKSEKDLVKFILKNGAHLSCNADNQTPMDIAKEINTIIGQEIVAILAAYDKQNPKVENPDSQVLHSKSLQNKETSISPHEGEILYSKRAGTSGVSGQFYETKLLGLVLFRALHDKDIEECYLAANIKDIGDFDDVCFRFKMEERGETKPVMCFTQAKHKEDPDKARLTVASVRSTSGPFSLTKYFDSFLKVKQKFYNNAKSSDPMFKGEFKDIECYFILYTPLKEGFERKLNNKKQVSKKMLDFISTSDNKNDVFQFDYENTDVELLTKFTQQEHIKSLGKLFLYFILNKPKEIMTNDLIQIYHPAFAQHVIQLSKVKDPNYLEGRFREEFFDSNDELLITLKETLFNEIVFSRCNKTDISKEVVKNTIKDVAKSPNAQLISTLIGEVLNYDDKNNKLYLDIDKKAKRKYKQEDIREITQDLQRISVAHVIIKEAIQLCGKNKLQQLTFQVPYTFGNTDFPSNLKNEDIPKERLDFLCNKFYSLIKEKEQEMDDNVNAISMPTLIEICQKNVGPKKILEHSHLNTKGIGGTVGNLLQFDPLTQTLSFNTDEESLPNNAKYMLQEMRKLVKNDLSKYRFSVEINNFPRMCFTANENDKNEAKEFFSKLWFFTNQAKEETVEVILKKEINTQCNTDKQENQFLFRVHSDAIFLRYHDEIQKWWKSQTQARYLTKTDQIFDKARKDIIDSPVLTVLNAMFIRALNKFQVKFSNDTISSMNLGMDAAEMKTVINIVSDAVILSATKIMQYVGFQKNYTFINLGYVHLLPKNDYDTMMDELGETKGITLVIVSETSVSGQLQDTFNKITNIFNGRIIAITDTPLQLKTDQTFYITVIKDRIVSLEDLDTASQKTVLEAYKLTYQGKDVPLNILIDERSKSLVCGRILWLILNKSKIEIGNTLDSHKYDEIKDYYINRCLRREDIEYEVNTLNDIDEQVVLITSMPCMGKSILLTRLSLETKKADPKPWIVRINLSNYSNEFADWQDGKVEITKIMRFLSRAALKNPDGVNNLEFIELPNGHIDVVSQNISFELKYFISSYNRGNVIILFDEFDSIYLQHTTEGIELLKVLKRANKRMWITISCYNVKLLEDEFGTPYTLDRLSTMQQESFLSRFWKTNLKLEALNHEQLNNVNLFLNFIYKTFNDKIELVSKPGRPVAPLMSVAMHIIYLSAVEHFKNEINNLSPRFLRETIKKKWRLNSFTAVDRYLRHLDKEEPSDLAGTPLHMYIAANYFKIQIKEKFELNLNTKEIISKSHVYLNTIKSYERFLKANMKHICEIENKDISKSQEQARDDFMETHKKLALYAICKESDVSKLLTQSEINEVKSIIKRIESGDFKTHFIDCVVDGIPRFYNLVFAEYFVVEFASDLIKRVIKGDVDHVPLQSLWDFIVNGIILLSPRGVRNAFDYKLKYDPELAEAASNGNSDKIIFELILKQDKKAEIAGHDSDTAVKLAVKEGLVNITNILFRKAHHVIVESPKEVDVVMNLIKGGAHMLATNETLKPVTDKVLDCIKDMDGEKVIEVLKSDQVEGISRAVVELCEGTELEKAIQDTVKSDIGEKVKNVAAKIVSFSENNENLKTLVETLPYHLPDIVNSLFGKKNK